MTCEKGDIMGELYCTSCVADHFLTKDSECVKANNCPINYYANSTTMRCNLCHQACLGCKGPGNALCKQCKPNFPLTPHKTCELIQCQDNEYQDINYECQSIYIIYKYIECNINCSSCRGGLNTDCIRCTKPLILISNSKSQLVCKTCEDKIGYYTRKNRISSEIECGEICGDGINLGEYECDDENNINGDGCSNKCRTEEGFNCQGGGSTTPDQCKDSVSPHISVNLSPTFNTKFKYYFELSEPVKILSDEEPKTFVDLKITGHYKRYIFDYEVAFHGESIRGRELLIPEEEIIDFYVGIYITLLPASSIMNNDV